MHNLSNFDIIDVESVCAPYYSDRRKGCSVSVFAGLLRSIRKSSKISQRNLGLGLCSVSEISRIENGEREAGFLLQSALLSRLGFDSGSYSSYVYKNEYDRYRARKCIIDTIGEERYKESASLIEKYRTYCFEVYGNNIPPSLKVELQFCEAMTIQLMRSQTASEKDILPHCLSAMEFSMPHLIESGNLKNDVHLTFQEIDILLEYRHANAMCSNKEVDQSLGYEELYNWTNSRNIDYTIDAIIFPKLAVYYAKYLKKKDYSTGNIALLAEMQLRAVNALRIGQKCYYLNELKDDIRIVRQKFGITFQDSACFDLLSETGDILQDIYQKYGKELRCGNTAFLYYEKRVFFIGDIISLRRKTLRITNEELCNGVCDNRVLQGLISGKTQAQSSIVKALLYKLKLFPDFTDFEIQSQNRDTLKNRWNIPLQMNNGKYEDCRKTINNLKAELDLYIDENKQAILYLEATVDCLTKTISSAEYLERLKDILYITIPIQNLTKSKSIFLSPWELICVRKIATLSQDELKKTIPILQNYLDYIEATHEENTNLGLYTFVKDFIYKMQHEDKCYCDAFSTAENLVRFSLDKFDIYYIYSHLYRSIRSLRYIDNGRNPSDEEINALCTNLAKLCDFCHDKKMYAFFMEITSHK